MIYLNIKGNVDAAVKALIDRGISYVAAVSVDCKNWGWYTNARVDGSHERKVIDWFCEEPHLPPFPPGTLLGYSSPANPSAPNLKESL